MAKKENKVSISTMDAAMSEIVNTELVKWNNLEIEVKYTIGLGEMISFVNDLVSSCFDSNGVYHPEAFAFSKRLNILSRYANISLPKDLSKRYEFAYSGLVELIEHHISYEQINDIEEAATNKIDFLLDTNAVSVANELSKVVEVFNGISDTLNTAFDDISASDLNSVISKLADLDEINEEGLVNAALSVGR